MNNKKRSFKPEFYIENILAGDQVILSRAITVIESTHSEDCKLAVEILKGILPFTGKSKRIGLTGAPGVGKSTFIESLGQEILSDENKLAVLTIDPSSVKTKGSILGDKTRMNNLSKNEKVFIRPSSAGQSLGGVSAKTREAMLLCEAAGFNIIIVETVGVGQSETLVKGMVDFFLLLMMPGGGDELQGIKRGIMELADMIVINKADGENLQKAKKTRQDYENAIGVLQSKSSDIPPVLICSSLTNSNIKEVWKKIELLINKSLETGILEINRKQQNLDWMHQIVKTKIQDTFYTSPFIKKILPGIETEVLEGKTEASFAANYLLKEFQETFYKI